MFRKPIFWVAFVAVSLGSIYLAARYFSKAFPIVTLDLQINREAALSKARELAARFQLGPEGYDQAASFGVEQEVQNFVELEAGGTEAFRAMMAEGLHHPYRWTVRHFKEGETRETRLGFTPRGDPNGFVVRLPETDPGAALGAEAARGIAEKSATNDWGIDLGRYRLEELSQEVRPGGRVDHSFVYERPDVRIGEGRYRLRLVVGGDQLTELTYFVKVPEAFSRRHEEMRSANNVISIASTIGMVILYIVGGCGVGLFFLLRQRWILWRSPLHWGLFIAFLQLLVSINQWPLAWMGYDTAISTQVFVLQQLLFALLNSLVMGFVLVLSFMAAESLSRRAFPHHPQQWRLWSPSLGSSKAVLGQTLGGYLLVGVFFAYEVFLYFVTTRYLGWWTPSDALVQPDVLATYLPWLSSIAISAQAGFWEESLFRAVPIAGAALLGDRFGRRTWWIAGAMIVQALIFGGGHAGYANQPSYARVVELIIPSLMFGGLYLYFGLLPAIVLHFAFDVVWFALPLFVSTAPGIWIDRFLVIALALIPLWAVVASRWRAGSWNEVSAGDLNLAWQPPAIVEGTAPPERVDAGTVSPVMVRFLPIAGLAGLALWMFFADFSPDAPPLTTSRAEVQALARQALEKRGIDLSGSWRVLTDLKQSPDPQDRFVWQTAGQETYKALMHDYLAEPHWIVRFARFEGDVAERAEEYRVSVSDKRQVFRFRHTLPEARPGRSVSESEARVLAQTALLELLAIEASSVKEVSAVPSKLKERTDWTFTFSDAAREKLPQGERRLRVQIGGDKVADAYRFVHVPEEWSRNERDRRTIPRIVQAASTALIVLAALAGVVTAVVRWSRKQFAASTFAPLLVLLFGLGVVDLVNGLPSVEAPFSTSQAYELQMSMVLGLRLVGVLLLSAAISLIAGFVVRWGSGATRLKHSTAWMLGVSLGFAAAGLAALGSAFSPSLAPVWGSYDALGTSVPAIDPLLDTLMGFLTQSTIALLLFAAAHRFTNGWTTRKPLFGPVLVVIGLVVAGSRSVDSLSSWLVAGLTLGIVFLVSSRYVLRHGIALVLIAVGVLQLLQAVKEGIIGSHPAALWGAAIAAVVTTTVIYFWYGRIERDLSRDVSSDASAESGPRTAFSPGEAS